ncbi:MAG: PAS domain S-box protein [Rhodospirillaceae bacterium]
MPDGMHIENEGRFAALVNSAHDVLWEMDAGGRFTFLSPSIERISGYTAPELIGRSPGEFVVESERAAFAAKIARHMERREPFTLLECTQRKKNGQLCDMEVNGTPFMNGDGALMGYRGVARDVTVRNRLLARQWHLAHLVDSANEAIMTKDLDDRITYWNAAAERLFGYKIDEVIGRHVSVMAPVGLKDESHNLTARMLAGEELHNLPTVRQRKDGTLVDILITYSPVFDAVGVVIGTSAIAKDITEQLRLERAMAAQTALAETQLTLSPDGILVVDAAGVIASYNPQFLDMWGLPGNFLLKGRDADALGAAVELVAEPAAFTARVAYLYAHHDEKGFDELPMKDGRVFQRYTAPMKGPEGAYLGRLWYFRDITVLRQAEARARQELERYGRSMVATVAALASTAELRDPYTSGHQHRVSEIAVQLAAKLGVRAEDVEGIRIAGLLHDIGKISIPAEILSKPGRLSPPEFELLKGHPGAGYEILKGVEFQWPVAEMVHQHHERLDGTGYPRGLKEDQILLGARILAVADVGEAMSAHRPYRPALGRDAAVAELQAGRGIRYDTAVVDAYIEVLAKGGFSSTVPQR